MASASERLLILEKLEKGEFGPDEAARLLSQERAAPPQPGEETAMGILEQLERGEISSTEAAERLENRRVQNENRAEESNKVKAEVVGDNAFHLPRTWGWWAAPILAGIALIVGGGLLMNRDLADGQLGFTFFCAWAPLALGVLFIALGWAVRWGPWLHFRAASRKPGRSVNLDMRLPVPLGIVRAFVQGFGVSIAGFDQAALDKLQASLAEARRKGEPVHIQTTSDDGQDAMDIYVS